jgi:hypothetical protein
MSKRSPRNKIRTMKMMMRITIDNCTCPFVYLVNSININKL